MIPGSFKSVLSVKMWLTDLSMETRNTFLFPKSDIKNSCTSFHLWCDGYVPITNIFSPYCWVDYSWIPFCRKKAHTNYNNCNSISPVILYNYSFGKTFFFFNFHYVAIKWWFSGFFFPLLCVKKDMHNHKDATFSQQSLTHFTTEHKAGRFSQHEHCYWANQNSVVKSLINFRLQSTTGSSCCGFTYRPIKRQKDPLSYSCHFIHFK